MCRRSVRAISALSDNVFQQLKMSAATPSRSYSIQISPFSAGITRSLLPVTRFARSGMQTEESISSLHLDDYTQGRSLSLSTGETRVLPMVRDFVIAWDFFEPDPEFPEQTLAEYDVELITGVGYLKDVDAQPVICYHVQYNLSPASKDLWRQQGWPLAEWLPAHHVRDVDTAE